MTDESYNFTQARTRLEEIVTQVRSKDVSLEKSLDLLEEGVRLANICTEQSDHTEWRSVVDDENAETTDEQAPEDADATAPEGVADAEVDADQVADDEASEDDITDDADGTDTAQEVEDGAEGESSEEDEA